MGKVILLLLLVMGSAWGKFLFFGSNLTITISPTTAVIPYFQHQVITATLKGKGGAEGVQWSTSAGTLIGATGGTNSVQFVPPQGCGIATIMAISKANPSKTATARITVTADSALIVQPARARVGPSEAVAFSASEGPIGCPLQF